MKKVLFTTAATTFVVALAFVWVAFQTHPNQTASSSFEPNSKALETGADPAQTNLANLVNSSDALSLLTQYLKSTYLSSIDSVQTWVALKHERDQVVALNPEQGALLFENALKQAFGDQAQRILQFITKLNAHLEWEALMSTRLLNLSAFEKQEVLWEQRLKNFGDQAYEIWPKDSAKDRTDAAVKQGLNELSKRTDLSPAELALEAKKQVDQAYSGVLASELASPSVLAGSVLNLESVQKQLASMSAAERQQSLNQIRAQLGYSPEEVQRSERYDQQQEQKWQTGYAYMQDRKQLEVTYNNQIPQRELLELQTKHFGSSAATINAEESQGFYRFERPRVYGFN